MNNVKLGNLVMDAGTGFTGIASMFSTYLGGVRHCMIQPSCNAEGSELPRAESFDYHLVDVIGDGIADRVHPQDDAILISLGQYCRDKVTGMEGIAVVKLESLQGCVQFGLTPKMSKSADAKYPESIFFDHKRLDVIETAPAVVIQPSDTGCIHAPTARRGIMRRG